MRGAAMGLVAGGLVLFAGPAYADGGLEVNPSTARPGQTIGISTGENCRQNDGTAVVTSRAFGRVSTSVMGGEADVSVAVKPRARHQTYKITLTCSPSNRKIYGAVTVKPGKHRKCWQDDDGRWHGKCYRRGPETGGGGSLGDGPTPMTAAGVGLAGAGAMVGVLTWLRRSRA